MRSSSIKSRSCPARCTVDYGAAVAGDSEVKLHGHNFCCAPMIASAYYKAVMYPEFLYDQLTEDANLDKWNHIISAAWMSKCPFPDHIACTIVHLYIKNGYIVPLNLLAAAKSRQSELIRIGENRKSRSSWPMLDSCAEVQNLSYLVQSRQCAGKVSCPMSHTLNRYCETSLINVDWHHDQVTVFEIQAWIQWFRRTCWKLVD